VDRRVLDAPLREDDDTMNRLSVFRMLIPLVVAVLFMSAALDAAPVRREDAFRAANHELPGFFSGLWELRDELMLYDLSGGVVAFMFTFQNSQPQPNGIAGAMVPSEFVAKKRKALGDRGVTVSGVEPELYGQDTFATIVISAVDTEPVVLRCFQGLSPHVVKVADAAALASKPGGAAKLASTAPWQVRHCLMLGLFDEAFYLATSDGTREAIVDMRTRSVTTPDKARARASVKRQIIPDSERVRMCQKAWGRYWQAKKVVPAALSPLGSKPPVLGKPTPDEILLAPPPGQ
jgi:hypothetical protein